MMPQRLVRPTNIEYLRQRLNFIYDTDVIQKKELPHIVFKEFLEILNLIKKENLNQFKYELFKLLESDDQHIRNETVATLGLSTRLFLPEFQKKAFEIFLNDPSDMVKCTALSCWCNYFIKTKNKDVLLKLYPILIDNNQDIDIRATAFDGILTTVDPHYPGINRINEYDKLLYCETPEEFNNTVNWDAVNKLMLQYAPEALKD